MNSLFSDSWYRVAGLKPRLRSHAQIHRHTYRQRDWYVLQDHSSGGFHRFSEEAYHIIGLMDGRRTLNEIWAFACANLGDDMPTQGEVIHLLSQLHQADVLQTDLSPDIADLYQRHSRDRRNRLIGQLRSPFAIRFPLFDPERFLSATEFLVRPLYGWMGAIIWSLVVISALILAGTHWEELSINLADRVLALENLFLLWLAYPIIKALHEFGHAYTVRHWGGEVHEMGIMLLVFMPVPYVDASSSSAFREKHKRMMVGGAGIITEAFLAAIAMWVWVAVEPGAVRALAFNVMIIAGVSTLLFNGNPLLRFDGYYVFSDFLEIPNLGSRANQYIGYFLKRHLVGIEKANSPVSAAGEAPWLGFYGIASFFYRLVIVIKIAMFVASKFFVAGVIMAGWGVISMLVIPLAKVLHDTFTDSDMQRAQTRLLSVGTAFLGLIMAALLALPLPSFTVAEGVLWPPENSQIYARTDGFVRRVIATSGQNVRRGDHLLLCENPEQASDLEILQARLAEFDSRHRLSRTRDRTEAKILMAEMDRIRSELDRKQAEKKDLLIESPSDGVFLLLDPGDWTDRFLRRGMQIGYVVDFSKVTARVVVPQQSIDRIRAKTRKISARLAGSIDRAFPAVLKSAVPAASSDLPSLALSLEGGGTLALDPRDQAGPRAFDKLFQFEIVISGINSKTIGERVFVRFEHHPEPLAYRLYRGFRRTLLSNFSV